MCVCVCVCVCVYHGPVAVRFMTYCFELVLRVPAMVQSPVGNFRPVHGIGANPAS